MGLLSTKNGKKYVCIAAPSGGGKSTLCKMLLSHYKNLVLSISHTTRKRRKTEQEGEHYFFVEERKFKELIQSNHMVEWAMVHNNYYGTSKEFLEKSVSANKIVLLDIDVQGVRSFKKKYPNETISFFILPPSLKILEERLRARGSDTEEMIQVRIKNAEKEISEANSFDHSIVNNNLEVAFKELCSILDKEFGV